MQLEFAHLFLLSTVHLRSSDIPVPAMLAGLGLRADAGRRVTTPDAVVDVDIELPGRVEPPGVTSPDREPV